VSKKNGAELNEAIRRIWERFERMDGVVVAFSGGVDSTVLAELAHQALGRRAVAVTVEMASMPPGEMEAAGNVAEHIGMRHAVVHFDVLSEPGVAGNPPLRCYNCKRAMIRLLSDYAAEHGLAAVAEGTNASEALGHRPGLRAVREAGALTPLLDAELEDGDVRALARMLGLPNADRPSAPCLLTRFPNGTAVTAEALSRVGRAEQSLMDLGFAAVRVRDHGDVARVEVPQQDLGRMLEKRADVVSELRSAGYAHVAMDLIGYRTGSMDEVLPDEAIAESMDRKDECGDGTSSDDSRRCD